jgi:hypothetical protein
VPLPPSYGTSRITGKWVNLDGTPATGTVTFSPQLKTSLTVLDDETIVVPVMITAVLDEEGEIDIDIPATDDEDVWPEDFVYRL